MGGHAARGNGKRAGGLSSSRGSGIRAASLLVLAFRCDGLQIAALGRIGELACESERCSATTRSCRRSSGPGGARLLAPAELCRRAGVHACCGRSRAEARIETFSERRRLSGIPHCRDRQIQSPRVAQCLAKRPCLQRGTGSPAAIYWLALSPHCHGPTTARALAPKWLELAGKPTGRVGGFCRRQIWCKNRWDYGSAGSLKRNTSKTPFFSSLMRVCNLCQARPCL